MKVGPIVCIVCLKTKEIIYINENRYFCRELKDDSLRKKFRSLVQKLRDNFETKSRHSFWNTRYIPKLSDKQLWQVENDLVLTKDFL